MRRVVISLFVTVALISSAPAYSAPLEQTDSPPDPVIPATMPGSEPEPSDTNQPTIDFDVDGETGGIQVGMVSPPGSSSTTGSGRPRCTWRKATVGEMTDTLAGQEIGDPGVLSTDQVAEPAAPGQLPRLGWWKKCGAAPAVFVWADPVVDINVLIAGAEARVRAQVPLPALDVNPAPEDGSYVNLGLWLALDDPGATSVRVDLAGVWARVTAQHRGFEVDFGNGDSTSCEGFGVSIDDVVPDWDTFEQGPCGYTYLLSSPEDDPYQLSVRSTWQVTYTTSLGTAGSLGTLDRVLTVDYDIDEVQTVGVAN